MTHPAFADATHLLITGVTGSGARFGGKTTTAAWLIDNIVPDHFAYGLVFSPKGNRYPGPTVYSATEAAEAFGDGTRIVEWSVRGSPLDVDDFEDRHAAAMQFSTGLNGDVAAVHDDAIEYANADSLRWCLSMAGNPAPGEDRIKSIVVSQHPWDLPQKGVRSNTPVHIWVGPLNDDGEKFFRQSGKGAAVPIIREQHGEPFRWSVVDGDGDVTTFHPVPDRYA